MNPRNFCGRIIAGTLLTLAVIIIPAGALATETFSVTNNLSVTYPVGFYTWRSDGQAVLSAVTNLAPAAHSQLSSSSAVGGVIVLTTNNATAYLIATNLLAAFLSGSSGTNMLALIRMGQIQNTNQWMASPGAAGVVSNTPGFNTNPPAAVPLPVYVYAGTNAPNGLFTAGLGSFYNQFDGTGTNFVESWVKGTATGNTGWTVYSAGGDGLTATQQTNLLNAVTNGDTRTITLDGPFNMSAGGSLNSTLQVVVGSQGDALNITPDTSQGFNTVFDFTSSVNGSGLQVDDVHSAVNLKEGSANSLSVTTTGTTNYGNLMVGGNVRLSGTNAVIVSGTTTNSVGTNGITSAGSAGTTTISGGTIQTHSATFPTSATSINYYGDGGDYADYYSLDNSEGFFGDVHGVGNENVTGTNSAPYGIFTNVTAGSVVATGSFSGPASGLTGTATGLSIGGNAATASAGWPTTWPLTSITGAGTLAASNSITSNQVAGPINVGQLTGTLPVSLFPAQYLTNGDTRGINGGAQYATDYVGTATGTGTVVENNSPTLINPILSGSYNAGSGTNVESLTIQATTNLALVWNGSVQKFVISNTPNFFLTWGAGWGDASFFFTKSNNLFGGLFNNTNVLWLSGSNNVVTNTGLLSLSSFGTNYIRATLVQP